MTSNKEYIYARHSKNYGWKSCIGHNKLSANAQLMLTDAWVMANIPNMTNNERDEKE